MGNGMRLLSNPFVLHTSNQSPLRGTKKIVLTPKIFAVPDFLLRNPHLLVTKTEIMATLWPGTKVVDVALRVSIWEIRKALNDNAEYPKFIETVGKSGYRWITLSPCEVTLSNEVALPTDILLLAGTQTAFHLVTPRIKEQPDT
jgi:DNA-binding winged helix-turn-helix (wHTH) protein